MVWLPLVVVPQLLLNEASRNILDDLLATGGTAVAATELLRKAGARVDRAAFVIDLPDLGGNARLASQSLDVRALMAFDGD